MPAAITDLVRREYDRLADGYDRRWRSYIDATLSSALEALDCANGDLLLDVPCGTGELEARLRARFPGLRVVGGDLSHAMLAKARAKHAGGRVCWVAANASRLPIRSGAFDHVVCANGFHYFDAPDEALAELRRALRPEGRLILIDWCDDYLACRLCGLWLRWRGAAFHRLYSLRDCRRELERAGFVVERVDRFRVGWIWGMMRFVARSAPEDPAPR